MKRGHDLSGVMKFATSPAWADHLRDALGDHFGLAMEEFDFEADELADIVGDHWAGVLWGCAFEDLLTRTIQPGDRNIVDDYIRRRGWNESGPTKIYLRALRSSVMSLHEVSEVEPGSGFLVRDLIRGGEPLRVSERSASQTLKQWDRIGARVVQVGGKHLLSGGVLSFTMEAAEALVADLRRSKGKRSPNTALKLNPDDLAALPALISTAWLFDVVPKTMGPASIPTLLNSDGEEVVFHRVRFPFARGVTQALVGERLDTVPTLQRETTHFWNWLGEKPDGKARSTGRMAWGARQCRIERPGSGSRRHLGRAGETRYRAHHRCARRVGRLAADHDRDDRTGHGRAGRGTDNIRTGTGHCARGGNPARSCHARPPVPRDAR